MFFSFDGIDGSGKTTQIELFVGWLEETGYRVTTCRDPGGTALGERLREILLDKSDLAIGGRAEMFLYMASRAQLVEEVIRPAREAGHVIVCDRFLLANIVYQGHAGGLAVDELWRVGDVAVAGLRPVLTFVLDVSIESSLRRRDREPDRMESRGNDYMRRVRQGFLDEADRRPEVIVVDAERDIAVIQNEIRAAARAHLQERL